MRKLILTLIIFASNCCLLQADQIVRSKDLFKEYDAIRNRIQVTPLESKASYYMNKSKNEVTKKADFEEWVKYEDEYLSFCYPKHPDIELEINSKGEGFSITGGAVGTTDHRFSRAYVLKTGETTYSSLMLQSTNEFDDGICFCGAIDYEKYFFHNGGLFRVSFLEGGLIKKIQVLSDKCRISMFEWTHMPLPQEIYLKIALSIKLKQPVQDKDALRERMIEKHGGLGFLEKGMKESEIIDLMGKPMQRGKNHLIYEEIEELYADMFLRTKMTIPLDDKGVFQGLSENWSETKDIPPKRGTLPWISQKTSGNTGDPFSSGEALGELTDEDKEYIAARFVELTPAAAYGDWNTLCQAMHNLAENCNYRNQKILPAYIERYTNGIAPHYGNWILDSYQPDNKNELIEKQVELIYAGANKDLENPENGKPPDLFTMSSYSELHNLICFIEGNPSLKKRLVIDGMKHSHPDVRDRAYSFANHLDEDEALPFLRLGLKDENPEVREASAKCYAKKRWGTDEDIDLLKDCLAAETDKDAKVEMETALRVLRPETDKSTNQQDNPNRDKQIKQDGESGKGE